MTLWQLTAPYFCAGVVLAGGRVVETAPILLYMVGWTGDRVRGYAKGKGWALCEL